MQKKSLTAMYQIEIPKFMLYKTVLSNDMEVSKDRRSCTMPNMLQISKTRRDMLYIWNYATSITEEVKNQAEQGINSRFIMYVFGIHKFALKNTPKGRRYGTSAASQILKKARDDLDSSKKDNCGTVVECYFEDGAVSHVHARTKIHTIRHGRIWQNSK